jgi:type I restriction enzyme R subunit
VAASSVSFDFLADLDPSYVTVAAQAEGLLYLDAPACLQKLRILGERLAQTLAAANRVGTYLKDDQFELLKALRDANVLAKPELDQFQALRIAGNEAAHHNRGDLHTAQTMLQKTWELAVFTRRAVQPGKFSPPKFAYPKNPVGEQLAARKELAAARAELDAFAQKHASVVADVAAKDSALREAQAKLDEALAAAKKLGEEVEIWEELADDAAKKHEDALNALRAKIQASPELGAAIAKSTVRASASWTPSEAEVREGVDEGLNRAGWLADTKVRRWSLGVRPEKGLRQAIAEVQTANGVADYVLFDGLDPVAVIEAKAAHLDVPAALEQAKRYARTFDPPVPCVFATNGREYFPQIQERSGIWFADLSRPDEAQRALAGWYTPDGLRRRAAMDLPTAHAALAAEPMEYLGLREYQRRAILAVEDALAKSQRRVLIAMATGTGKTRTCLGLVYRLLKARRFHRVLFLVDREALADQAWEQFASVKLESLRSLTEIYDAKPLVEKDVDPDTRLHVATVQGLIRRVLGQEDPTKVPPVDQYDCIVVDECHRGYTLDSEMTETQMRYRSESEYLSRYRRALEHFDAVCVGLTATPALHTTTIFGRPVYQYRFRDAVLDGWLMDQEPVIRIRTTLSEKGVRFEAKSEVERWNPVRAKVETDTLEDAIAYDVDEFNARVIVPAFNRAVCEELVKQIDPETPGKTLIFCVNDAHADAVVNELRTALREIREITDPDVVAKITGRADQPLKLIRRFRLERLPDIAVTVDLLSTGVDVPAITSLVFLRAVRSRILYEQMIGRATRPCGEINKSSFKVFDAVGVTEALRPYSAMRPVAARPAFGFHALLQELRDATEDDVRVDVLDQLFAKLRARASRLSDAQRETFAGHAGADPTAALASLRRMAPADAAAWWDEHSALADWFEAPRPTLERLIIAGQADEVTSVEQAVAGLRPEEYLAGFDAFLDANLNLVPALQVVVQRPRDLTRKTLKEVRALLEDKGFREPMLQAAWRQKSNADIAAGIVGHIRQHALGSPLRAYELRVDTALEKVLAAKPWTEEQKRWLSRIARQMKQEVVVDRSSLDLGAFANQGGAKAADAVFEGQIDAVLGDLLDAAWQDAG